MPEDFFDESRPMNRFGGLGGSGENAPQGGFTVGGKYRIQFVDTPLGGSFHVTEPLDPTIRGRTSITHGIGFKSVEEAKSWIARVLLKQ